MSKFKEVDWRSVHSMSEDVELVKIEEWTQEKYDEFGFPLSICEIGSYYGKTTALLAQFGNVLAIDLWGDLIDGLKYPDKIAKTETFYEFIANMKRLDLINHVFPIIGTSVFVDTLKVYPPFDVIFIDGAHDKESVYMDLTFLSFCTYWGSIIILHDYRRPGWGFDYPDGRKMDKHGHDPWWGVAQAVDEFLGNNREWKIKEHYLGVVCLEKA